MSGAEIAVLKAWNEAGCPEGDRADAPPPRSFASDRPMGEPDQVLTKPEPYTLEASGKDDFRVFVLRTNLPQDRYIRAVDFKPGNRTVVHHILAAVDTSGRARELDAAEAGPGYASTGFGDGVPLRSFLPFWTPGSRPREAPEGAGYFLPAGADILLQIHYHKSGKPETDATAIGLYLSDKPLEKRVNIEAVFPTIALDKMFAAVNKFKEDRKAGKRPDMDEMLRSIMVIPAGEERYEVKGSTRDAFFARPLSRDILVTAVVPHMHWLGTDFVLKAKLPGGDEIPLIKIDQWNFNWQGTYVLEKPVRVPRGAWFEMVAHFDNSDSNPLNPSKPAQTVSWGNQTNDEMCIGVVEWVAADESTPR
ncbi:MAG: ascorbate-dependent monooxygenase [Isosphaeraceae bacterium]